MTSKGQPTLIVYLWIKDIPAIQFKSKSTTRIKVKTNSKCQLILYFYD
jgi:hypothetical protein